MPIDEHGKEFFPGVYRGVVEDVNDPEERLRVRVRIHLIHDDSIPNEHLQWCEVFTDEDRPLQKGNRVAILFEGADRNFPFVLGRWLAAPAGLNDLKPERTSNFAANRNRRMIYDDADNLIELNASRRYVRVKSGNSEVRLVQADDSIQITANGPVTVQAKRANINVREFQVDAGDVKIAATGRLAEPDETLAFPATSPARGKHEVFSNFELNLYSGSNVGLDSLASINIGQVLDGSSLARQTGLLRMRPSILQLGEAAPTGAFIATLITRLEAATTLALKSLGVATFDAVTSVDVTAPVVNAGVAGNFVTLAKFAALAAHVDGHRHEYLAGMAATPTFTSVPAKTLSPAFTVDPMPATIATANFKAS